MLPSALSLSGDEEEVVVMGGEGFTPEEIAAAEKDFERRLVRLPLLPCCVLDPP